MISPGACVSTLEVSLQSEDSQSPYYISSGRGKTEKRQWVSTPKKRNTVRNIQLVEKNRRSCQHSMFLPRTIISWDFLPNTQEANNMTCGQSATNNEFPGKYEALSKKKYYLQNIPPFIQVLTATSTAERTLDWNKMWRDSLGILGVCALQLSW